MTQEKREKVFLTTLSASIVVFVLAIVILVFQGITIINRKNELKRLNAYKVEYERMLEEGASDIEEWQQKEKIEDFARRLGYKYPEDVEKS